MCVANLHTNTKCNRDSDIDGASITYADGYSYGNVHDGAECYAHSYSYCNSDCNFQSNIDAHCHSNIDFNSYANSDSYPDTYSNGDSYVDANADSDPYSDTDANAGPSIIFQRSDRVRQRRLLSSVPQRHAFWLLRLPQ